MWTEASFVPTIGKAMIWNEKLHFIEKDSKFDFNVNFDFVSGTISKLSDDGGSEVNGHSDKVNLTFFIF